MADHFVNGDFAVILKHVPGEQNRPVQRSVKSSSSDEIKMSSVISSKRSGSPNEVEEHTRKKKNKGCNSSENGEESNDKSSDCSNDMESVSTGVLEVIDENKTSSEDKEGTSSSSDNNEQKSDHSTEDSSGSSEDESEDDTNNNAAKIEAKTETVTVFCETKENASSSAAHSVTNNNAEDIFNMDQSSTYEQFPSSDFAYYQGHPLDAEEEYIALTHDKLSVHFGNNNGGRMERPHIQITDFSIYNELGYLCPIDIGLGENETHVFMSGFLKSICAESDKVDQDSVPVKDIGPIIEWFIHGFDGEDRTCFTLSTEYAEYKLMKPNDQYKPILDILYEKIWICKIVVEYIQECYYLQPTYDDLLEKIKNSVMPDLNDKMLSEEILHKHAHFICDQIVSFEAGNCEESLIDLPCMRELIKLVGIKFGKLKKPNMIMFKKSDKKVSTKAITTPLVKKTFEILFKDQLDKTNHELILKRKRCGVCVSCQEPDCGECIACMAMAKFGGQGLTKKVCDRRLCPNMEIEHTEDSDTDDEGDIQRANEKKRLDKLDDVVRVKLTEMSNRKIQWIGEPVKADATKIYYEKVVIEDLEVCNGDFVMLETAKPNIPALVSRVVYMWKETNKQNVGFFHGEIFTRATDTVLGEVGDPREVFLGDRCCHGAPLTSILRKAYVEKKEIPKEWCYLGGKEVDETVLEDDGKTYFYSKYYERFTARFEDLPETLTCPNELRKHRFCPSCERKTRKDSKMIPKVVGILEEKSSIVPDTCRTEWTSVKWQDCDFKKGCGVFLKPGTFKLKNTYKDLANDQKPKLYKANEDIYTEYYRKTDNNMRGSNVDTGEPFCIGYIAAVTAAGDGPLVIPQDIYLMVNVMYRPENTNNRFPQSEDTNIVYWNDEIREVPFSAVTGLCHLTHERNIPTSRLQNWLEQDPTRFYFRMAYDEKTGKIVDVPQYARDVGMMQGKNKGKGKGKGKSNKPAESHEVDHSVRPLRTLDVFAGCGGLSAGLHAAGAADCRWAIENGDAAAHAYALNNKSCSVFHEDCNSVLRDVLAGIFHNARGIRLPRQGEVELLCGGPPCQGFSGMNRFNSREYSNFKNSLVASFLSYCDYYRPQYFILENVRNFVAYKKGMVLKLTLRALLDMGYQCTFGVLQAGNFGVPQTRRRLIILAAAPEKRLPLFPEPTHVFSRRACSLTTTIDGKRFSTNVRWDEAAPHRTCTIRDAMSDLPEIENGANQLEMEYSSMPEGHFQRSVRSPVDENQILRDHICKHLGPLAFARICHIPTAPGCDWRDLPNLPAQLSDGTKCKILQYRYDDKRNGRTAAGGFRGVCSCAADNICLKDDKQENTLIPWCLPHTANRHNNWAGLYGRVNWEGYFSTTVTDPEPMGKQGRVLHPEQNRVVSVRECARSQGFHDSFLLAGSLQEKHTQIGNAVPPPLALALGREIKKSLVASMNVKK